MRAMTMAAVALLLSGGGALAQGSATATVTVGAGMAPAPPPAVNVFASSAEVQALIANARKMHPAGQPMFSQKILSLAPYNANMEHRTATAPASLHEKDAELFYVIEGSATLVTGGKLEGETRANPANLTGTGIAGGDSRAIAKGDFIIVPQNTPHQVLVPAGGEVILMTFHAPRG